MRFYAAGVYLPEGRLHLHLQPAPVTFFHLFSSFLLKSVHHFIYNIPMRIRERWRLRMKRFKVLNVLVLILILFLIGLSQEQAKDGETADDLLIKFIEYFDKNDGNNAINCLKKAIELDPTKGIYFGIMIYMVDGKFDEALKLLEERKEKSPSEKERNVIQILAAATHYLWAKALKKKSDYINAIAHYEAAYEIDIIYRRNKSAVDLNNIGFLYDVLGQKQKALEYYEKALPILREVGNRSGEAATLNNIGRVYDALDQKQKALEYYEKSLPILREVGDRSGEATILNNIGAVCNSIGQKQKALEYYDEKILPISREVGYRSVEAITLNNIGMVYSDFGQQQKALEYYKQALPIHTSVGNRSGEATTLNNIGCVYYDLGQKQKALEYLEKILPIFHELGDNTNEAVLLCNLMITWDDMNKNSLAIFYGKQAVNTLQYLRQNIDNLDVKTKLKYLKREEDTYRITASQLIFFGRLGEALQLLDILKDEEYFSFVLQNRSVYTPQYNPIDYTSFERKWIDWQNTLLKKMSSISRPYHELLFKPNKTPEEEKKLETLKIDMEKTQTEYSYFLDRMKKVFETYKYKEDPDIDLITRQSGPLKEYLKSLDRYNNGKNAALHFLVYKGQISVIITTPTSKTVIQSSPFYEKEFNKLIYDYRYMIEKLARLSRISDASSKEASKINELSRQKRDIETKLYELIFKPVHEELQKYGAVNLLVSLDGVLRYIPLGGLWDGEHYLVQQYRFVLITPSSLNQMDEKPVIENKILGMGASKGGKGFKPLPHAGQEIRAIVHDREKGCKGLINGNALIDNNFTREKMINRLKTTSYPLVHIASHFKFSPGNETNNQLLLGDGTTMNLSDIRKEKEGKLFDNVKLLVLSACQTGMGGNGEEIDGFGRLAQQCGAGSVIASLWSVDDESTKELMVKFYSILEEGKVISKIEALRLAQLHLAGLEDMINKSKATTSTASARKSNPYYWAPFIMMGNWR
jgi:CHAT domain-containing protein/Tfp pilus assembly protein PilF